MKLFSPEYFQMIRDGSLRSAREIVPLLCTIRRPTRVVDVACGTGEWLKVFREHGAREVLGVDAHWVDMESCSIRKDEFLVQDISKPLNLAGQFDLALMLEAIQHVPANRAADMVRTLTKLAPFVLMSAPIPHQGGSGNNVHEQWPAYWASLFRANNFVCIDILRRLIWQNENVEWWYAQNLLLYVHRAEVERNELLRLAAEASPGPPLPLIHPKLYESRCNAPAPQRAWSVERLARGMQLRLRTAMNL